MFHSALIILGRVESCGLWQLAQSILPSRTGWCDARIPFARICGWQEKQVSDSRVVFNCVFTDLKEWTLWHVVQERSRRSWTPPIQLACRPWSWHVRQALLMPSGAIFLKEMIVPTSPFSVSDWRWLVTSP